MIHVPTRQRASLGLCSALIIHLKFTGPEALAKVLRLEAPKTPPKVDANVSPCTVRL